MTSNERRETSDEPMEPKCDIILLSYENPALLKSAVESVLEFTDVPSRLIIIDNASRDPKVKEYLDMVTSKNMVLVDKIYNGTNEGFARGMNKGLRISTAPFVCLLNNDCVVTSGWLSEMINVASQREEIGLVNPASNTFGASSAHPKKGKCVELGHAIGFAMLIKRAVIKKIGYLDESYLGVCYEDTDYSCLAQRAGFIPVLAEAAYVFHKEQASRRSLQNKRQIYERNRKICDGRWGKILRVLVALGEKDDLALVGLYKNLIKLARKRVFIKLEVKYDKDAESFYKYLEDENILRHADITFNAPRKRIDYKKILLEVLVKKKRYDAVITDNRIFFVWLKLLGPLRGTKAFLNVPVEEIVALVKFLRQE